MNIKSQIIFFLLFVSYVINAQLNCEVDTIPPIVECLPSIALVIQEGDQLLSSEFVITASDNCIDNDANLMYSFSPDTLISGYSYGPFGDACDDVAGVDLTTVPLLSLDSITVYVSDSSGNVANCKTEVSRVEIDEGDCQIDYDVYFSIFNVNGQVSFERTPSIEVLVSDDAVGNADSTFFTMAQRQGDNYKYRPTNFAGLYVEKPIEFLSIFLDFEPLSSEYITVTDLLLVQNHILGLQSFKEEWQFVAADVNSDNTVNVLDLLILRNIILGNANVNQIPSHKLISDMSNELDEDGFVTTRLSNTTKDLKYTLVRIGDLNDQSDN